MRGWKNVEGLVTIRRAVIPPHLLTPDPVDGPTFKRNLRQLLQPPRTRQNKMDVDNLFDIIVRIANELDNDGNLKYELFRPPVVTDGGLYITMYESKSPHQDRSFYLGSSYNFLKYYI